MIKAEMIRMLRNDIVNHPSTNVSKNKSYITTLKTELEKQPLEHFTHEELNEVRHYSNKYLIIF